MPTNLSGKPRLVIVSDTAMWVKDGKVVAFEPVVREIENFYSLFGQIIWIGYQWGNRSADANTRTIAAQVPIQFIPLKAVGGPSILDKLKILWVAPFYGLVVWRHISRAEVVHTRAPSLPAFWAIGFSFLDRKRIYWHKYAGNWQEPKPPFFYNLQRRMLQKLRHTRVTINGAWKNQPPHLLNFENPCLSEDELLEAQQLGIKKQFDQKLTIAFVGNLAANKGILELLEAFTVMKHNDQIEQVIIAGDGILKNTLLQLANGLPFKVGFTGYLTRSKLKEVYAGAHFICLPSYSEGFPKVIAEGAAFGCVPIVSDVSAIGQYVKPGENGFLLQAVTPAIIAAILDEAIQQRKELPRLSKRAMEMARLFTYERFKARIVTEILNKPFTPA